MRATRPTTSLRTINMRCCTHSYAAFVVTWRPVFRPRR